MKQIYSGMKQPKAIHDLFLFEDDLFRNEAEIIRNVPCTGMGQNNCSSDTDPMWPTQTTPSQGGKLVYLQEENPCSWGKKNPMSHLSRMKNPDLPCPHVAAALRAYSYVLLDDVNQG